MEKEYKTVGQKIRELRETKGVSQLTVATEAGMAGSYLSLLELGTRPVSNIILQRIAEYFEITVEELLEDVYIEKYGYRWLMKP